MESQAKTIRDFWASKLGRDGSSEWVDRIERSLDEALSNQRYHPKLDHPELLIVIELRVVDHPAYAEQLSEDQYSALRLRYLGKGWHLAEIRKERGTLLLGSMRRPVHVNLDDGTTFDAPYQDGMTPKQLAEHLGFHGAWRYGPEGAEFIPPVRIASVRVGAGEPGA